MAEAEIIIREDDDLLREINQQAVGMISSVLSSHKLPWLRPRGSADSVLERDRYPLEDARVFDACQQCGVPLAGCITASERRIGAAAYSLVLSGCGHVLCEACKDGCRRAPKASSSDPRPLLECPLCREYGAACRLPGADSLNGSSSSAARAFSVCDEHQEPISARCDCGEMVCARCPYNYDSAIPGTSRVQHHAKTPMEEVDLSLEDALANTIGTLSRIRAMRSLAKQKRQALEETTDRMANEVALHFNQIIVQAIQRCFDVLGGLKQASGAHHSAIENHLRVLKKTERQLLVGVEMDERARARKAVKEEDVAQYVRNVAYGLCRPALAQFEASKEFSARLEDSPFSLVIESPPTREIAEAIGRWGDLVLTNAENIGEQMKEVRIPPSPLADAVSLQSGSPLPSILVDGPLSATDLPLRVHTALDHFTDLYERRFLAESMLDFDVPAGLRRELPFQLGQRAAPESGMSSEDREARYAYERVMRQRPGMHMHQPKMFGGHRRLYNLAEQPAVNQREVAAAYERTPCLAPIWMSNGGDPAAIPPRRRHVAAAPSSSASPSAPPLDLHQLLAQVVPSAAAAVSGSRPPTPAAAAASARRPSSPADIVELVQRELAPPPLPPAKPAGGPTVLRKKNLVFVKKAAVEPPPVLDLAVEPEESSPRPAQTPRATMGASAPSRLLGPSILRRMAPQQQTAAAAASAAAGPKMLFRPATNAERAFGGATRLAPLRKPQLLLTDSSMPSSKRLHLVPAPGAAVKNTLIRDASGKMLRVVRHAPVGGRAPGGMPSFPERRFATGGPQPLSSRRDTAEEERKRAAMRARGFREVEIDRHLDREKQATPAAMANLRVVVPVVRAAAGGGSANVGRPRYSIADDSAATAGGPQMKKRMLPIERAFTNMFGADGSLVPAFSYRRRGRPAKDDPTAPSNIIAQFRKHTTQWPPKFDEMDEQELAELRDLIEQLDAAREEEEREEGGGPFAPFDNGQKSEEEDAVMMSMSHWQTFTPEERRRIRATAEEKLQKGAHGGCFVCNLFRRQGDKPRTWQCAECLNRGRPLTPIRDDEVIYEPPAKRQAMGDETEKRLEEAQEEEEAHHNSLNSSAAADEEEMEEEGGGGVAEIEETSIDLSALFKQEAPPKVERRGRPRKNKDAESAQSTPQHPPQPPQQQQRTPKEPKKRREAPSQPVVEEATTAEEEVVMGTTRRGRQIKMPAKLKGHEVTTAHTTRTRSPSPEHAPSAAPTPSVSAAASPTKKKMEEKLAEIKEEPVEPPEPRSAMDAPKRGGRRRH